MNGATNSLLGIGIYTVPEASRITGVSSARIRRWLRGYERGERHRTAAVIHGQLPEIDGHLALGFHDLLEAMVIDGFRKIEKPIPWSTIHLVHAKACVTLKTEHPLCDKRIKTLGREIILDISEETHDQHLLNLATDQLSWKVAFGPYLHAALDFSGNDPSMWWPLGRTRRVVIDPARMFGKPIVAKEAVRTDVLAKAYRAIGSLKRAAWWYEVSIRSVRDAVEYEERLAA